MRLTAGFSKNIKSPPKTKFLITAMIRTAPVDDDDGHPGDLSIVIFFFFFILHERAHSNLPDFTPSQFAHPYPCGVAVIRGSSLVSVVWQSVYLCRSSSSCFYLRPYNNIYIMSPFSCCGGNRSLVFGGIFRKLCVPRRTVQTSSKT